LVLQKHIGLLFSCTANLTSADFERIERWLAQRRSGNGYKCGDEEEPAIDDALVYALILDGSPRSQSILSKMLALERSCKGTDTIAGETLEQAQELVALAKEVGHDLRLEPGIDKSVRASAFFLPAEYRNDSKVELLFRTDNRILLDVSYNCGRLCGRGYYVVLRKEGSVWQYAVIRMAWIS